MRAPVLFSIALLFTAQSAFACGMRMKVPQVALADLMEQVDKAEAEIEEAPEAEAADDAVVAEVDAQAGVLDALVAAPSDAPPLPTITAPNTLSDKIEEKVEQAREMIAEIGG